MGSFAIRKHFFAAVQKEKNFEIPRAHFHGTTKVYQRNKEGPHRWLQNPYFLELQQKNVACGQNCPYG